MYTAFKVQPEPISSRPTAWTVVIRHNCPYGQGEKDDYDQQDDVITSRHFNSKVDYYVYYYTSL